jgi:uroporphyrinogen decarboxylase
MAAMTKRERVRAAVNGGSVDRVPIALWGHFPSDPHRVADLVAETLRFQQAYDWDLVKMMPSGMYFPEALGCTLTPAAGPGAVNGLSDSVIKEPADWTRLPVLDARIGWLAEHLESVRQVREALGPDVPIIQTLFSPLTVAHKMSLHLPFKRSVSEYRAALETGLRSLTDSSLRFAEATLDAGADGFFFATQEANRDTLSEADFASLGKRYDLEILQAIRQRATLVMLHVCRENIYADLVADYPVDAINWEPQKTAPTLGDARGVWRQTLVGGLDRYGAILKGTPRDVRSEVADVIRTAGREGFIVSAGCALPIACPPANLLAARQAVEAASV